MRKKIWLIVIKNKIYGPFSLLELKKNPVITPDTLAKKVDDRTWKPIKKIPELKQIFYDEESEDQEDEEKKALKVGGKGEAILSDISIDPGHFFIWLLIVIIILTYASYRIFYD